MILQQLVELFHRVGAFVCLCTDHEKHSFIFYLIVYEFRYRGNIFNGKRYVRERFMNVRGLFMRYLLSKFELKILSFLILHTSHHNLTKQLKAI